MKLAHAGVINKDKTITLWCAESKNNKQLDTLGKVKKGSPCQSNIKLYYHDMQCGGLQWYIMAIYPVTWWYSMVYHGIYSVT